jgi:hypothetical protein
LSGGPHPAQCRQSLKKLIATHPQQSVPLDEHVEVHRVEIPPRRVRESCNVARRYRLRDPFYKASALF